MKACIFDLDGTLADTITSIAYSCNQALEACGLPLQPEEDYKYYAGDGAKTLVERALVAAGDTKLENIEKAYDVYTGIFKKDCTYKVSVFEGMADMLKNLKSKGIKLAVLSNKPHLRTIDVIDRLFGPDLFDFVQGQCDQFPKKPAPDGATYIAKLFNIQPDQCVYVGDTNTDMQTGKGAGMFTVGVLWGFRPKEELEANHADAIVSKPEEILKFF